jgi:putative FmdB family regulatory protein
MPIYEFRCMKCNEYFELLIMNREEQVDMKCEKCGGGDIERILSKTSHSMGSGKSQSAPAAQTRNCSSGSCTTIDLPGHSR